MWFLTYVCGVMFRWSRHASFLGFLFRDRYLLALRALLVFSAFDTAFYCSVYGIG